MISKFTPEVWIGSTAKDVIQEAGRRLMSQIKKVLALKESCSLVLSGGTTPKELYRWLATQKQTIPWQKISFFFSDERFVSPEDSDSNYRMAKELLFNPLEINPSQIYPVPILSSPEKSAELYQLTLQNFAGGKVPVFDVVLLGLGNDGHTASIFPFDVRLNDNSNQSLCWAIHEAPKLPADRVSLSPYVINQAQYVMMLVTGSEKAAAVSAALESDITAIEIPIRAILPVAGKMVWLIDQAAAVALPNRL